MDEFPYLVAADSSLPSRLKWLDHDRPKTLTLCILGSSQTMMQEIFLNNRRPLYMRARRVLNLKPLAYRYFCECVNNEPIAAATFEKFSLVGGIPKYWQLVDGRRSTFENAEALYFGELSFFDNETLRLISEEAIHSTSVLAILEAIGRGTHKPNEIATRLGIKQTSLSKGLSILVAAHLIAREQPFAGSERNAKKSLYKIIDPFLLFFYGVFSPHRSRWSSYTQALKEKLIHDHASLVFEQQYREIFPASARHFEGKDLEFDCVRHLSSGGMMVSELKFRSLSLADERRIHEDLKRKIAQSQLQNIAGQKPLAIEVIDMQRGLEAIFAGARD